MNCVNCREACQAGGGSDGDSNKRETPLEVPLEVDSVEGRLHLPSNSTLEYSLHCRPSKKTLHFTGHLKN
jgi:hypothetical protein